MTKNSFSTSKKRTSSWWSPLLMGACLALGYGTTQRLIVLQGSKTQSEDVFFKDPKNSLGGRLNAFKKQTPKKTFIIQNEKGTMMQAVLAALQNSAEKSGNSAKLYSPSSTLQKRYLNEKEISKSKTFNQLFQTLPQP